MMRSGRPPCAAEGTRAGVSTRRGHGGGGTAPSSSVQRGEVQLSGACLQEQCHLAASDSMQLGIGIVGDGEELVHAAQEQAALLVRVSEQRQLRAERRLLKRRRRGGALLRCTSEGLGIVVRSALELREESCRGALVDVESAREQGRA